MELQRDSPTKTTQSRKPTDTIHCERRPTHFYDDETSPTDISECSSDHQLVPCRVVVDERTSIRHTPRLKPLRDATQSTSNDVFPVDANNLHHIYRHIAENDFARNRNCNNQNAAGDCSTTVTSSSESGLGMKKCALRMTKSDARIMKKVMRLCRKRDRRYRRISDKSILSASSAISSSKLHRHSYSSASMRHAPLKLIRDTSSEDALNDQCRQSRHDESGNQGNAQISTNNSNRCPNQQADEHCRRKETTACCDYDDPLRKELRNQCACILMQCRHIRRRPAAGDRNGSDGNSSGETTTTDEESREETIKRCELDDVTSDMRIGYLFRFGCKKIKKSRSDLEKEAIIHGGGAECCGTVRQTPSPCLNTQSAQCEAMKSCLKKPVPEMAYPPVQQPCPAVNACPVVCPDPSRTPYDDKEVTFQQPDAKCKQNEPEVMYCSTKRHDNSSCQDYEEMDHTQINIYRVS